ncbi:MAG: F0F1 ATP synthase subunit A [Planctomycetota bacterium]|nr:F0F1 ATP synthase subunit A [Planctomycetota bacterium]
MKRLWVTMATILCLSLPAALWAAPQDHEAHPAAPDDQHEAAAADHGGGDHDDPTAHVKDHALYPGTSLGATLASIGVTKHVLMLWIAGLSLCMLGIWVGRARGPVPTGLRNMMEAVLFYLRDEVVRPNLGKDSDRFLPVIWTFFFFILFCNLLGLIPTAAAATGNISVTATLAGMAFIFYHAMGIQNQGLIPYLKGIVPGGIPFWIWPVMLIVEVVGHAAKPFALAVRLFANMIAGHIVLSVILGFATASIWVAPVSIGGAVFMYVLEIFVAFLQAFVFTFLMTVFLGMAVHPQH